MAARRESSLIEEALSRQESEERGRLPVLLRQLDADERADVEAMLFHPDVQHGVAGELITERYGVNVSAKMVETWRNKPGRRGPD